jgi:hypothetical protein
MEILSKQETEFIISSSEKVEESCRLIGYWKSRSSCRCKYWITIKFMKMFIHLQCDEENGRLGYDAVYIAE